MKILSAFSIRPSFCVNIYARGNFSGGGENTPEMIMTGKAENKSRKNFLQRCQTEWGQTLYASRKPWTRSLFRSFAQNLSCCVLSLKNWSKSCHIAAVPSGCPATRTKFGQMGAINQFVREDCLFVPRKLPNRAGAAEAAAAAEEANCYLHGPIIS